MIFYKILISSEFFCFLFGLMLSITNITYIYLRKKWKLFKFKKLLINTYINPIISLESDDIAKFENKMHDCIHKLSYLKNNELVYNNCDYQFELIRMVEYVKAIMSECMNHIDNYGFRDIMDNNSSYDPVTKKQIMQIKNYLCKCMKYITKYYKLRIDDIPEYSNQ